METLIGPGLQRGPRSGGPCGWGSSCPSLQTAWEHGGGGTQKGMSRSEVGATGPSQPRPDTPITDPGRLVEEATPSTWRRLGRGWSLNICPLTLGVVEAVLGLDKQTETGIWKTPSLPPPLPSKEFPWMTKMCLSLPGVLYLASSRAVPTPPPPDSVGPELSTPPGHLGP